MGLKADDSRSPSVQIAADLRDMIRRGDVAPGARLPTARELEQRYGVANMTVQNAIRVLKAENLVYTVHGRGTFVRSDINPTDIDTGPTQPSPEYLAIMAHLDRIDSELRAVEDRLHQIEAQRRHAEPD
jgi:DNA-binding FadR family transcriptional regulator